MPKEKQQDTKQPEKPAATEGSKASEDQSTSQSKTQKAKPEKMRYFRNRRFAGERFLEGNTPPFTEAVRFTPFYQKWGGEFTKVGYLKTNNPNVIKRIEQKGYIEEISKKEFKEFTDVSKDDNRLLPV